MDIKIPQLAESVTEGDIGAWLKKAGERVAKDEPILELETDKATVELAAETAGTLEILVQAGVTVRVGDVVGRIAEGGEAEAPPGREAAAEPEREAPAAEAEPSAPTPSADTPAARGEPVAEGESPAEGEEPEGEGEPAAAPPEVAPAGDERVTRRTVTGPEPGRRAEAAAPAPAGPKPAEPGTRRERMTRLRQRIAERLVEAQRTAAILTTFNEIDMSEVIALRQENQERFEARHGIRLGFMSLFAKASILALEDVPALNAFIDGNEIVYHDHVHLGVAVGTPRGLVVPVVREADRLSFAAIERRIKELATKARDGEIAVEDLQGGTFTISNGGIYGSLLSTPILNPPQSGILGMHKIEKRPIVLSDERTGEERVVPRPMMYVALSYDHRIVDGEQAVTFLVKIKERLEDPTRLLLDS